MNSIKQQIDTQLPLWLEAAEKNHQAFPCDFDVLWKWAGYSRKDHAKTALKELKTGSDFVEKSFPANSGKIGRGRPTRVIHAKMWQNASF